MFTYWSIPRFSAFLFEFKGASLGGNNNGEVIPGSFPRDVDDCVRKTELNSEKNVVMVPRKPSSKSFELQAIRMN